MSKLNELTIYQAIEGLKAGKFSSVDLVKACFEQIKRHNKSIFAFLSLNEENALKEAAKADEILATEGESIFNKHPLLGIPYACKDNFCTKGIETTASAAILKGFIPPYESTVTQRLKDAGAILLGKTNMDAFAHGSSTETSDFGTTKNPWNFEKVPGGSSGGSGAAVAAHMCTFAIGSETAGSIRVPASWCGVTGLKPTYGRVSRYGVIAMASSTDSPGPITKSVEDAAYILNIIAGVDAFDATSSPAPVVDYTKNLEHTANLKHLTLGIPKSYFVEEMESGVKERIFAAIEKFTELGAKTVEVDLIDPHYSIAVYTILQRSEVSSNLARFDGIRFGHERSTFGFEAKKRMMLGAYALSAGYYDQYYSKAQRVRTLIVDDFKRVFEKVDLLIAPTLPSVALDMGASEKSALFGELTDLLQEPSSIAGLPAITIPCGLSENLPVGVQLIGPHLSEEKLLASAHLYEQSTDFHKEYPNLDL